MKAYLILLISIILLISCKTRQVALQKWTNNTQTDSTGTKKQQSSSIDTTRQHTVTKQASAYSSHIGVDIETDTGTQHLHVNPDGSMDYHGKAKKIKVTGIKKSNARATQTVDIKKGESTNKKASEKAHVKKKTTSTGKIKEVKSYIDWGKTIELFAIVAVLIIAAYLIIKRFSLISKIKNLF